MKITFEEMEGMNVPKYCRKIMKETFPDTLEIYRNDMLCLTVNVAEAAELRLVENENEGPLYKKYVDNGFIGSKTATRADR